MSEETLFLILVFVSLLIFAVGTSIRVWLIRRKYRHLL